MENSYTRDLSSKGVLGRLQGKNQAVTLAILAGVGVLVYMQWRAWRSFDWGTFVSQTSTVDWRSVLVAIGLVFLTYFLRALRWKILLQQVRDVGFVQLLTPTLVGFTGLALLGRAGELVRPYLIARRTNLSMASQMGVWTVERVFDLGAFASIAAIDIFVAKNLPDLHQFRVAAYILTAVLAVLVLMALVIHSYGTKICSSLEARFGHMHPLARTLAAKLEGFIEGLNTVHSGAAFVQVALLSCATWLVITLSYLQILHAFPGLRDLPYSSIVLLVGFSMIGGLVQLPAVGGGAQLATILALARIFAVPTELAVSAGILLWLVSFQAVTPIGLLLARRDDISIRGISYEVKAEEPANFPGTPAEDLAT